MRSAPPTSSFVAALLLIVPLVLAAPAGAAQTTVSVGPFRSVTLRSGGVVNLRHGASQRVTLIKGDRECASVRIEGEDELVIEPSDRECDRHDLLIEVTTPEIAALKVTDGGTLRAVGGFPAQKELDGRVENGGSLDLRTMKAGSVRAAVRQGGRILIRPESGLLATVTQGGVITYWGSPDVKSTIEHGGAVTRGKDADFDKPLKDVGLGVPAPVPPVPPVPPGSN